MIILLAGLLVFIGVHSVRIVADGWRGARIARIGLWPWKAIYSLLSIAGLALIVWGYGETRTASELWSAPVWLRHGASLLMLVSFLLLVAAYLPRNHLRAAVGHPMVVGVKVWALAHLLTNSRPGDLVLFGALLAWAVLDFRAARQRDRANPPLKTGHSWAMTVVTAVVGIVTWAVFARFLHPILIGVPVV